MKYYVVTFTHTKIVGWAIFLHAHVKYLKKLLAEDKLQISGPGVGTPVRSAQLVFKVAELEEVHRLIAADPYSIHGLVASSTVHPWHVKWGSMEKPEMPDAEGTKYFRATYTLKGGSQISACDGARDAYLKGLLQEKKLRAAGPYADNAMEGLLILSVPDAAAAEAVMREDPFVKELGASYEVIRWDPKFGEFK